MNPEVKAKWVAALRSGDYEQGQSRLKTTGGKYCCLGVLCDLYDKEHQVGWSGGDSEPHFLGEHLKLPTQVMAWAGIEDGFDPGTGSEVRVTHPNNPNVTLNLSGMNDRGDSFEEIAGIIEEQL